MKILLIFFTIVLFSFNAKASNDYFSDFLCAGIGIKSSNYYGLFYAQESKQYLKSLSKKQKKEIYDKSFEALDKSYKFAIIYNTFCKK